MNESSANEPISPAGADKIRLRRELIEARSAQDKNRKEQQQIQKNLANYLKNRDYSELFCYLSTPQEAPTWALLKSLLSAGTAGVSCPRIVDKTTMIAVRLTDLANLERGPLDIFTSSEKSAVTAHIDIAIVPGVGFTTTGARLGYGGGYYDRWFEQHPETFRIAFAYDRQIVKSIPTEAHDQLMHVIVTERRVYECM